MYPTNIYGPINIDTHREYPEYPTKLKGWRVSENISSKLKWSVDSHSSSGEQYTVYIADSIKVALGIGNWNNAYDLPELPPNNS